MITQVSSTIEINPELANLAYEMGLNASKIGENALKLAINRLQGFNVGNNGDFLSIGNSVEWTERDLNPRLPRCERGDHARLIYRPMLAHNES